MRVSASQIKMFNSCPMQWYLAYVHKVKQPSTQAQIFGSCFHMAVEYFLRTKGSIEKDFTTLKVLFIKKFVDADDRKELDKVNKLCLDDVQYRTIMRLINNARPKLKVWIASEATEIETEINGEVMEGITYIGYIDLRLINHTTKEIFIFDHKTTSDFKYGETPYTLPLDIQMGMYCKDTKDDEALADYKVYIGHIQYLKKSPNEVRSFKTVMEDKDITSVWDRVIDSSSKMQQIADEYGHADDWVTALNGNVHQNLKHCSKFRTKTSAGCAFIPICKGGLSPERLKQNFLLEEKSMENLNAPVMPLQGATNRTQQPFKQEMAGPPPTAAGVAAVPPPAQAPAQPAAAMPSSLQPLNLSAYTVDVGMTESKWDSVRVALKKEGIEQYLQDLSGAYEASCTACEELGVAPTPSLSEVLATEGRKTQKLLGKQTMQLYTLLKALIVAYPAEATGKLVLAAGVKRIDEWRTMYEEGLEQPDDPNLMGGEPAATQPAPAQPAATQPTEVAGGTMDPGNPANHPPQQPAAAAQPQPSALAPAQPAPAVAAPAQPPEQPAAAVAPPEPVAQPAQPQAPAAPVAQPQAPAAQPAPPAPDSKPNYSQNIVLVDCFCPNLKVKKLHQIYAASAEALAGQYNLADIRCHQYNEPIKQLLGHMGSIATECSKHSVVMANYADPVDATVVDALERIGFTVIRGTK